MSVNVLLPTPLQRYAENRAEISVEGESVGAVLQNVVSAAPQLGPHLFDAKGNVRSFVNVYLGDEDTRYLRGKDTPVKDGDTLTIVPSIAGGRTPNP